MRRFYATFLVLLISSSIALTALLSAGGRLRAGEGGAWAVATAAVSFAVLLVAFLLLLRIMLVLARRPAADHLSGQGEM